MTLRTGRVRCCAICSRALAPDAEVHACPACIHRTRGLLAAIVAELPELQECLALGAAPAGGRSAGRAHAPLPLRLDALNLLGPGTATPWSDTTGDQVEGIPLVAMLRWWADHIGTHHIAAWRSAGTQYSAPCSGAITHGRDAAAWCRWLVAYLPYAAGQLWIHQLHDDLVDALDGLRAITRTVPQRHNRLAPCPQCDAIAMVAVDGEWEVTCEVCGHRLDPDDYADHASAVLPVLTSIAVRMTAAEYAEDAPVVSEVTCTSRRRPRLGPCPHCGARAMAARKGEGQVVCEACGRSVESSAYADYVAAVLPALTTIVGAATAHDAA